MTVLFADLVDSTRLVASLDPEAARDLLNETFRRLAAEVRRFGGTLEQHIGDAILAVFGFPTGHDDDAARAVRAALAMRDIVKTAETALGDIPLQLRIGLDTGEALCRLAGPEAGEAGPGNTRELAAALAGVLCGLAPTERVLVVLEDLHWATRDLLEVASTLAEARLAAAGVPGPAGARTGERTGR